MPHEQMIDAFSAVIQNSLSLYEEQTPIYYYLTICGSWVLTALGILSLVSVFFTIKQKKPYRFIVPILFLWLGYEGIHMPRPNLAVFWIQLGAAFLSGKRKSQFVPTSRRRLKSDLLLHRRRRVFASQTVRFQRVCRCKSKGFG